jgi:crotonobetainyl-CoA:carnitine CoA-transferase CaiB-like acyl-CoA transferase
VLRRGGEELVDALSDVFLAEDAGYWQTLLGAARLGCVRADGPVPSEFWLHDEQVAAMGLTPRVEHPGWGSYRRHGPVVLFDGTVQELQPPPLAGQHNAELVALAGYDSKQVAQMEADGVLFREPE